MKARAVLIASLLAGCGEVGPDAPDGIEAGAKSSPFADGKADGATFYQCIGSSFSPAPKGSFNKFSSRLIAALGNPIHSSQDVVAQPGSRPTLTAKFAYGGLASKDLEGEWVWVFIDWCDGW